MRSRQVARRSKPGSPQLFTAPVYSGHLFVSATGLRIASTIAILLLSGCQSIPTETLIPVPVPCIAQDEIPAKPPFATDATLLAMPDAAFIIALGIDRQMRIKYIGELEAVMTACVK